MYQVIWNLTAHNKLTDGAQLKLKVKCKEMPICSKCNHALQKVYMHKKEKNVRIVCHTYSVDAAMCVFLQ